MTEAMLHPTLPGSALSPEQAAIVRAPAGHGPLIVWGAPGTGKSTLLVELVVHRVEQTELDPSGILLLAPSRSAATRLRDQISARLARTMMASPARTWTSYAFDVLRRAQAEGLFPGMERRPRLISGPEQDLYLKELLEGHALGLSAGPDWPEDLSLALDTRGFRQEIRELFDRVIDHGLLPEDLDHWGQETGRQSWRAAATLFAEYRDLIELQAAGSFDPAGIVREASDVLARHPDFLQRERERFSLVLVDDVPEAGWSVHTLLRQLGAERDLVMTACPDAVVQGFRGARPDAVGLLRDSLMAQEASLSVSHRLTRPMTAAWQRVAERIGQSSGAQQARQLRFPEPAEVSELHGETERLGGSAEISEEPAKPLGVLLGSEVQQRRYLVERLLHFHVAEGRSFADLAVIVPTGAMVSTISRYLANHGVPVSVGGAESAIRDEPAVRPLLLAFELAVRPTPLTPEEAVDLLTSRIGGLNSVQLRRLRQALRMEERASGGRRSSDELLVEVLERPAQLELLGPIGRLASRTARMLAAGRAALSESGANPQTVLWALWEATALSDQWASAALQGDALAAAADRDLDALMALFQIAERYADQAPAAPAAAFVEYLKNQELPMDTLAARAAHQDSVEVLTPASAAGREWPIVLVAGVQEGIWPNTRLRGELLGSQELVELLERGPGQSITLTAAERIRDIRYDELRSFSVAISRASERLICCAVSSEDEQPSGFLDLVDPWVPSASGCEASTDEPAARPLTEVARPKNLRSLVGELRQKTVQGFLTDADPETFPGQLSFSAEAGPLDRTVAIEASGVLGQAALAGAPGADPRSWWGLAPLSTTEAILDPDDVVSISPSRIETALDSPLKWFIQAAGGEAPSNFAQSLGTLVHAIAQRRPAGTLEEYLADLEWDWPSLGLPDTWVSAAEKGRGASMLAYLAEYIRSLNQSHRMLLGVERDFAVELPAGGRLARLRGQVDRLERDEEGRLVIIDLKTGKVKPTAEAVKQHPQLAAYQTAIQHGAFAEQGSEQQGLRTEPNLTSELERSGGAALVQLGDKVKSVPIQHQDPLTADDQWAQDQLDRAAQVMSAADFASIHDPQKGGRTQCKLPEVCPLCSGKQVTE
ncbi:ATP-dependent helicase [Psychromicrobium xiongbiense]|uniref:ATP-dependent helicase n=1 Tax=Psychromicrobium xiongbiense TaxID=3051184 RepID=UPI0025546DE8|nr:ATP-dependent DNA helicase [Psychromicrobium sp. YIM S02556]